MKRAAQVGNNEGHMGKSICQGHIIFPSIVHLHNGGTFFRERKDLLAKFSERIPVQSWMQLHAYAFFIFQHSVRLFEGFFISRVDHDPLIKVRNVLNDPVHILVGLHGICQIHQGFHG